MTEPATDRKAPIFDVQSFSIHDGPGIRTTVFFKGCPLDCVWCHNPESKRAEPQLIYYKNRCTGCLLCVETCKTGAQIILPGGAHGVIHEKCTLCGKCIKVCCYEAVKISGKIYSPEELYDRIKSDIRYFALETGGERGGITFSGGEPLQYADFIKNFCSLIPGVHTAMDTSGSGDIKDFEKIIDCIDLFLFDIKAINSIEHKKFCGADNNKIFQNLKYLCKNKKDIILRLPIVPGINDTKEYFDGISEFLTKYPHIKHAEILPYHNYGLAKAEGLGLKIPAELPPLNTGKETVEKWLGEFAKRGMDNVRCSQ
ncbi:MAG: glycyl-radical enzyme activating protein [Treponema sp.]|nr:glycyl-radical enzyme activating protein [Treponema sp.]